MAGLEVIGAGFGRTGTTSLKHALEILGYPCYHMEEVAKHNERGHVQFWYEKYTGESARPYDEIFAHYRATVDFPACTYYRELMEVYPDARVLLSVRDSEGWWKSFEALLKTNYTMRYFFFIPPVRRFYKLVLRLQDKVFDGPLDKARYIKRYESHNAEVQATVPPEKLLVWNVKEGWEPLCEWLGEPVPDLPFPHSNAGMADIKAKMWSAILGFFLKPFGYRPEKAWERSADQAAGR